MKKKIILGILIAICAGSCAFAACANPNSQNGGNTEPPVVQESLNTGVREDGDRAYAVVYGLGTITSTDVEIPAEADCGSYGVLPVEAISFDAFKDTAITSVTIPSNITSIGSRAFSGCTLLTTVTMSNGAESVKLGEYVFENCTLLSSVTLSNSVTHLPQGTFKNCSSLTSLTLPDNLQSISEAAFNGTHITSFDVTGCDNYDWSGGLLINKNTTGGYIAEYANPDATEVVVAEGVTIIEPKLFKDNKNIRRVDLNGTEIFIGHNAFTDSSLEELLNYENVTEVNLSAFEGTPWLENMLTGTKNIIMGKIFLLYRGEEIVFSVPEGIEAIGARAFAGTDIKSVTLPDSVDSIGNGAFADCKILESIILEGRPPYLASDDIFPKQVVIYVPGIWLLYYESNILWKNSVTNQILPNPTAGFNYTLSDDQTYYEVSYRSATGNVEIPESYEGLPVKAISSRAFYSVKSITGIKIPNSITTIGDESFFGCDNLKSITIPDSVTSMGCNVFEYCTNLESVNILCGITAIESSAFKNCKRLESVTIPDSVTSIGYAAFENCKSLKSIVIPDNVTAIERSAFRNCQALENINIPDSVTCIEYYTFSGCSGLKSLTIPDSVTSIGYYAFSNCSSLESIKIPNGVSAIEMYTFSDCSGLKSITIPDSVTSIGDDALRGCASLKTVTIPSSVTSIGDFAFSNCENLTSVTIPQSVTYIGKSAFAGCSSLVEVVFEITEGWQISAFSNGTNGMDLSENNYDLKDAQTATMLLTQYFRTYCWIRKID